MNGGGKGWHGAWNRSKASPMEAKGRQESGEEGGVSKDPSRVRNEWPHGQAKRTKELREVLGKKKSP